MKRILCHERKRAWLLGHFTTGDYVAPFFILYKSLAGRDEKSSSYCWTSSHWYIYCVSSLQFDHVIRLVIDSVQNIADVINYNSQLHECIIIPCFNVCKHSFLCGELMSFTFVLENINMFIIVRFILFINLLCIYM